MRSSHISAFLSGGMGVAVFVALFDDQPNWAVLLKFLIFLLLLVCVSEDLRKEA